MPVLNKKIVRLRTAVKRAEAKMTAEVAALQKECDHDPAYLVEAPYQSHSYGSSPPVRMCLKCGMTEDGWHCGNIVLKSSTSVPEVTRDFVYTSRAGLMVKAYHKGPLLRGEVTIAQLVDAEGILEKLGITIEDD